MSPDKLIHMANQIATFFTTKPEAEGLAGIAEHINAYWEPRMRNQLFAHLDAGGAGLHPLFIAAAKGIKRPAAEAA
ncbi:MAG: formate dehydrogenase subunit delta [Paracoccaceae bacterium]